MRHFEIRPALFANVDGSSGMRRAKFGDGKLGEEEPALEINRGDEERMITSAVAMMHLARERSRRAHRMAPDR